MKITSRKIEKLLQGGFFNSQIGQQALNIGVNGLSNAFTNFLKTKQLNNLLKQQQLLSAAQYKLDIANLNLQKAQEAKDFASLYMQQKQQEFANGGSENASPIVANYLANQNMGNELAQLKRLEQAENEVYKQALIGNKTDSALGMLSSIGQTAFLLGKGYRLWNNQRLENYRNQQQT